MREFVFDLTHTGRTLDSNWVPENGSKPVRSTGMGGCLGDQTFWRVESFQGPTAAMDAIEEQLLPDPTAVDQLTEMGCDTDVVAERFGRTEESLDCYIRIKRIDSCETVYTLAAEHIDSNVLFEFDRDGDTETWRVLMETDERAGLFYDALQAALRPDILFNFDHIGEASGWPTELVPQLDIPTEQRAVLELAVDQGYYETPRQVTLDDLAAMMDCPRSTLSYRLRRAESRLAKAFSASGSDDTFDGMPQTPNEVTDE
ncbi:helix-turn-helix domain-containing protein [Halorubrum sp. AD140]|uniref:helix-turn-helix domain-containing protein n=1 Tax=Halorubrum sp. AD140 TaxID=3050073 RepID=UPI002ACC5F74|nr:helix-turn-helix domain-containing protein [Halorubrum sp. AD140]MDZ5811938.1 helix-turn-helix domain-containing protein [Halorubrum sp. AD140]